MKSFYSSNHNRKNKFNKSASNVLDILIDVMKVRDSITGEHSMKVCRYAVDLAAYMGLKYDEIENIKKASMLHDIGKMGIPDSIILKPEELSKDEYDIIKRHPEIGYLLLKKIDGYEDILPAVLLHHERVDGTGYPYGLKSDEIPASAKIISIVDAFDAMTSNRPYRMALDKEEAKRRLLESAGTQFDKMYVQKFVEILE